MAIKDLLVAYDGSEGARTALDVALQMGTKYQASVTALNVTVPAAYESHVSRWIPDNVKESMRTARLEATKAVEAKFREQIATSGFTGDAQWLVEEGLPDLTIARSARFFDMLVIGQFTSAFKREHRTVDPEELLHRTGKPLLIIPLGYKQRPFKGQAAVAWDGSRHAARALTDAMQILETKNRLAIISVKTDRKGADLAELPGLDIAVHLKRHGVEAEHVHLRADHHNAGQVILDYCAQYDPDVLVMGAYGRAKFGVQIFGGVTRYILEHQNVPVLLSH